MGRNDPISRRTALKVTGAAAATALVAGCNDDDDDNGEETYEMDPGETILFYAEASGWEGRAPDEIDGVQNPTLVLEDGEEYEIGWEEGDGDEHNIELRDDGGDVIEGTDLTDDENPDDQVIEFTADDEIAVYRCEPHPAMEGDIQVE